MALSAFQREICQLVARNRLQNGESYLAGASALNELVGAPRLSRAEHRPRSLDHGGEADERRLEHGHEQRGRAERACGAHQAQRPE